MIDIGFLISIVLNGNSVPQEFEHILKELTRPGVTLCGRNTIYLLIFYDFSDSFIPN